jgi:hypothetical protein
LGVKGVTGWGKKREEPGREKKSARAFGKRL